MRTIAGRPDCADQPPKSRAHLRGSFASIVLLFINCEKPPPRTFTLHIHKSHPPRGNPNSLSIYPSPCLSLSFSLVSSPRHPRPHYRPLSESAYSLPKPPNNIQARSSKNLFHIEHPILSTAHIPSIIVLIVRRFVRVHRTTNPSRLQPRRWPKTISRFDFPSDKPPICECITDSSRLLLIDRFLLSSTSYPHFACRAGTQQTRPSSASISDRLPAPHRKTEQLASLADTKRLDPRA